jgi:hypothetical protein
MTATMMCGPHSIHLAAVCILNMGATSPGHTTLRCPTSPSMYHHAALKAPLTTPRTSPTKHNHPSPTYQHQHPTCHCHAAQVPTPYHSAPQCATRTNTLPHKPHGHHHSAALPTRTKTHHSAHPTPAPCHAPPAPCRAACRPYQMPTPSPAPAIRSLCKYIIPTAY